jgi:hypothetical protein
VIHARLPGVARKPLRTPNRARVETLALPLAVRPDGRLARTDAVAALLSVIRAMAAAPASSWAHAPWFGLQEAFGNPSLQREDQHDIQTKLNLALRELGVTWATVVSVNLPEEERRPERSARRFDIALQLAEGNVVHRSLNT